MGNNGNHEWDRLPLLEALRPDSGWETDLAVLATYSLELKVLALALMELAGRGSASLETDGKVDFAFALEKLRDKVAIVTQTGRIHSPRKHVSVFPLLDQFIRETHGATDEGIWHPKVALIRMICGNAVQWRLWIGSRNFTTASNWDLGLTLVSSATGKGAIIEGIPDLAELMFKRARLNKAPSPAQLRRELSKTRWLVPKGLKVARIHILGSAHSALPLCPPNSKEVCVISPFLDNGTVKILGAWGSAKTNHRLISTVSAMGALKQPIEALSKFDARYLASPSELPIPDDEGEVDEARDEPLGLHAKLIAVRTATETVLWMGSANATAAAWRGKNVEVVAELRAPRNFLMGMKSVFDRALRYEPTEEVPCTDALAEALDNARHMLSRGWKVSQTWLNDTLILQSEQPFHPVDQRISLRVGLLDGELHEWPRDATQFSIFPCKAEQCSELVRVQLAMEDKHCEWLQVAPFTAGLPSNRDEVVLYHYLSSSGFMTWIRAILTGADGGAGGDRWDDDSSTKSKKRAGTSSPQTSALVFPTLEDVLKAFLQEPRNSETLQQANDVLGRFWQQLDAGTNVNDVERECLAEFRLWWNKVTAPLLRQTSK